MFLAYTPPPTIFSQGTAAFRNLKAATVDVDVATSLGRAKYHLEFVKQSRLVLRVKELANSTERIFAINGSTLTGYDPFVNERLNRRVSTSGTLLERLNGVLGTQDDPIQMLLSPAAANVFFKNMGKVQGWKIQNGKDGVIATRRGLYDKKQSTTELAFNAQHLLTRFAANVGGLKTNWKFTYGPAGAATFSTPRSARLVESLLATPQTKWATAGARKLGTQLLHAYQNLNSATINVRSNEGNSELSFGGGKFREVARNIQWSYDGRVLSIYDPVHRRFYRGRAGRGRITDYLGETHHRADPFLRTLLARQTPYGDLLTADSKVKSAGTIVSDGASCDILQVVGTAKVSLLVRQSDHLLQSVTSDALDQRGRTISSTTRTFQIHRGAWTFKPIAPAGLSALPLPKVKPIKIG